MIELFTAICLICGLVVVAKVLWKIFGAILPVLLGMAGVILMVFFLGPLIVLAGLVIFAIYKLLTPAIA